MPTYAYRCKQCDTQVETFLSISDYAAHPPSFVHCGERMERMLAPANLALVSEASYKDLRASDGTDISSRAKHRAYMKANNLTTVDDFKSQWQRDAQQRNARLEGHDPERARDVAQAMEKLGG